MPFPVRGTGGGGGGGSGLGPAPNTFGDSSTADRAAAEVDRDTQAAMAAWLALYDGNLSFWIRLVWNGGVVEQRRNAAGTGWEDVTHVIRGPMGDEGSQGQFDLEEYANGTATPTIAGGGSYVFSTGVQTLTTGTTAAPTAPGVGEDVYRREASVNDAIDPDTVDLTSRWSAWVEGTMVSLERTGAQPQVLSGNIDWDAVDDAGFFTIAFGSAQTNAPTGAVLGACHVFSTQTYLVQIGWTFETSARTFTRTRPGAAGTPFGPWERIHIPIGAIVALLEARTGASRLNAVALRLIADAIDTELGNAAWRTGGGGGFDLHDDVTDELTGNLGASDRFLISDENVAGDPNRYVTLTRLQDALVSAAFLTVTRQLTTEDRANELIQAALTAAVTGNTETSITVTHNADGTTDFVVQFPGLVTQSEAEAGMGASALLWSPQRVAQAIAALAPGGQTSGLNLAQVNARVQAGLMAAVNGNTETGIAVTYNVDGTLDFVVGSAPVQTHLNYVGVRAADTNVVAADLTVSAMTASLTLPDYAGLAHLIYAYPTVEGPPSGIYLYQVGHRNVQNQSSIFGVTGTVMLAGEEHTWRATDDAQSGFGGYVLEQAR